MTIDEITESQLEKSGAEASVSPIDQGALSEVVTFVWPVLFGQEIAEIGPQEITDGLTASISIAGSWTATLVISMSDELAGRSAAALLEMEIDELDDECIRDAIGEIANVVGGNLKGLVEDQGDLTLSLPVVARPSQDVVGATATAHVSFDVDGDVVSCRLFERN